MNELIPETKFETKSLNNDRGFESYFMYKNNTVSEQIFTNIIMNELFWF